MLIIGIDPGVRNGFAAYDPHDPWALTCWEAQDPVGAVRRIRHRCEDVPISQVKIVPERFVGSAPLNLAAHATIANYGYMYYRLQELGYDCTPKTPQFRRSHVREATELINEWPKRQCSACLEPLSVRACLPQHAILQSQVENTRNTIAALAHALAWWHEFTRGTQ